MGLMMYPVLIVLCVGIVRCEETDRPVTVTSVTSVTPATGNSTSRVLIENKVQNLTVAYNSDHGQNATYVVDPSPGNQTTEKPLIISTSKEIRLIQTPPSNDSIAAATAFSKSNSTLRRPNEIKHNGRANHKDHSNHFLPTLRPEPPPKFADLSKYANPSKSANLTKVANHKGSANPAEDRTNFPNGHSGNQHPPSQNPQSKHPSPRHAQNFKPQQFNNQKPKKNLNHASEIEMEKVEMKEVRYVEIPKDNKKFRFYMADEKRPSTSSQTFEMTFPSKSSQRNPNSESKQMDKYKVRPKPYYNSNQNYQNPPKPITYSTAVPLEYMTPPHPTIYTVRPRVTNVNNISITTAAPLQKEFNASNYLGAKVQPNSGPRDFSCLRCFGHNKPHKSYKYPSYPNKRDPMLEGNRAVKLLGPDGDNFLMGGSNQHYVVVKPETPRQTNATSSSHKGQKPMLKGPTFPGGSDHHHVVVKPETPRRTNATSSSHKGQKPTLKGPTFPGGSNQHYVGVKPETPRQTNATSSSHKGQKPALKGPKIPEPQKNQGKQKPVQKRPEPSFSTSKRPDGPKSKPQSPPPTTRNPYQMDGLGSYASSNLERPEFFSVPEKTTYSAHRQKENQSARPQTPQKTRNPYLMDGYLGNGAASNLEFSVTRPNFRGTQSPFKLDPASDLYNLDEEVQASASSVHKHHGNVKVETKEIHIPVPEIIETRVPYPIHIKVDRLVPVHIDKPYPVHIEKKVPVPVKINVPQPYPVEKEVPYPVKIPIEVPRPVQVDKPVPYLVENPVPVQVFKQVKVPVKVPVDVPVPYKVNVQVEKRVPYFVEKKVPFEVPVPVEKPYLVEVKKPFEVPQEKPQPITVEKKIPVPVQVVEFVKVPVPVHPPHGQHSYQHSYQHRFGEISQNRNENVAAAQSTRLVEIPFEQNRPKSDSSSDDQSPSSSNHQPARMQVVLPHMISVEFPADFGHQPTGPASGFLPTASDAQVMQT